MNLSDRSANESRVHSDRERGNEQAPEVGRGSPEVLDSTLLGGGVRNGWEGCD